MQFKIPLISEDNLQEILNLECSNAVTTIILVGLGASVNNSHAIASFTQLSRNIIYIDTLNTTKIKQKIEGLRAENTAVVAVSKSGTTSETLLILEYLLKKKFASATLYVSCSRDNSPLWQVAQEHSTGDKYFIRYEDSVSGRFSPFLNASLLPVHLAGGNISGIRELVSKVKKSYEYQQTLASKLIEYFNNGKNILVISVYDLEIIGFAKWLRQIIAESLGKNNFGITSLISEGSVDEHSQLELYLGGPDDKIFYLLPFFQDGHQKDGLDERLKTSLKSHMESFNKIIEHNNKTIIHLPDGANKTEWGIESIISWMQTIIYTAEKLGFDPFSQPMVDSRKADHFESDVAMSPALLLRFKEGDLGG